MKRLFSAVCIVLILAVQTAFCANAAGFSLTAELEAALSYSASPAEFGKSDWTEICRARLYGGAEEYYTVVLTAAEELLSSDGFVKPTDLQRAAIALSASGECPRGVIDAAAYRCEDFDRQGFNAWIWALIAANCSGLPPDENALYTKEDIAAEIISRQLPDGGFTLRGESADTDITAAAIYALAPLCTDEEVNAAVTRAVTRLAELQLADGGFASMGTENCESTAQAVIAFTAAGVSDERLSRAVSALLTYRQSDGGFAHTAGGKTNALATAQATQALTALALAERGEQLFAARSGGSPEPTREAGNAISPTGETAGQENNISMQTEEADAAGKSALTGRQIKLIISAVLGAACLGLMIFALAKKRKCLLIAAAVFAAASGGVWLLDIKSAEEYYAQETASEITVTFSADCSAALDRLSEINESVNPLFVIPEDGVVISKRELGLPDGATAFDALTAAARQEQTRVDYNGSSYGVYVSGIAYIREFGFGEMSGWMFRVNGEYPEMSCGAYTLSDGDTVEFVYTCDIGRDF